MDLSAVVVVVVEAEVQAVVAFGVVLLPQIHSYDMVIVDYVCLAFQQSPSSTAGLRRLADCLSMLHKVLKPP